MRGIRAAAAVLLIWAAPAGAQSFPARSGETGILDVPDAEVVGPGGGQLAAEIGLDRIPGRQVDLGGLPIYAVGSLWRRLDVGLTMRDWAQPGDPQPARIGFGAALKAQLLAPTGPFPGLALSGVVDRFNERGIASARLALSMNLLPLRLAMFGGAEAPADGFKNPGAIAGVAAAVRVLPQIEVAAEALTGPRGQNVGGAIRWLSTSSFGTSLGANYFPGDDAFRISITLAFAPMAKRKALAPSVKPEEVRPEVAAAAAPQFVESRPRFRLRIPSGGPQLLASAAHLQYAPPTARTVELTVTKPAATGVQAAAPSLEDLADAQIKEQEALAAARERRVVSTSDQLGAREKAALGEAARLEARERELTAREQQLDARERRIAVRGAPTQQLRQLESLEAQLASQERQLLAQERSLGPAIEAAQGRERDAATREETERAEATRLAASVASAGTRAQQLEARKQALAAKNRQLASLEARLVAKGERIDALERQLRAKGERLDAWSRRLDTRSERLDALEKRTSESRPAAPKPPAETKAPGAAKDKAVFVMVVKSPTAIVREGGAAKTSPQAGTALHPGVAVEKAVAAATVVAFPTPTSKLSELDRETVDNIAKLAAKERCELLIWARAKDPSLMGEAQKRADEIKTRAVAIGPLDPRQVVTRMTTRPGAQGVDVVVSALRETAKPAEAPATAPSAPALQSGESGKRQIREAVVAAQAQIEACVTEHLQQKRLQRAEGSLKLTVSPVGKVVKVTTTGGDLAGEGLEACLGVAAPAWQFPSADSEYVVDVPITVVGGGAK